MAAAAAVFCAFLTGAAIGAADTFTAFFLLPVNIQCGKTDYHRDNEYQNKIFHKSRSFLLFYAFFVFSFAETLR